jgi:hypothetical protein
VSPVIEQLGAWLIVTSTEAVSAQPLPFVPMTVYVPAVETVMEAVVSPVFHKYVAAPVAVSVTEPPRQVEVGPEIFTSGLGLTVTE